MRKKNNMNSSNTIVSSILIFVCLFFISIPNAKAELSPIPDASMFSKDMDKYDYKIDKQPHGAELFRWDFENKNQYVYSYLKKTVEYDLSNLFGIELGKNTTEIILTAILSVNSLGNHTANLVLKNIETVFLYKNSDNEKNKKTEKKISDIPETEISSIDESGTKIPENNKKNIFTELLFSLPKKRINIKEQININKSIPIAINGKIYYANGELKITLTDYVIIEGRKCARFIVIGETKNLNVENGNIRCAIMSNTVFYFDIECNCLFAGDSAILQSIRYEDKDTRQQIINDNHFLISIKLKNISKL